MQPMQPMQPMNMKPLGTNGMFSSGASTPPNNNYNGRPQNQPVRPQDVPIAQPAMPVYGTNQPQRAPQQGPAQNGQVQSMSMPARAPYSVPPQQQQGGRPMQQQGPMQAGMNQGGPVYRPPVADSNYRPSAPPQRQYPPNDEPSYSPDGREYEGRPSYQTPNNSPDYEVVPSETPDPRYRAIPSPRQDRGYRDKGDTRNDKGDDSHDNKYRPRPVPVKVDHDLPKKPSVDKHDDGHDRPRDNEVDHKELPGHDVTPIFKIGPCKLNKERFGHRNFLVSELKMDYEDAVHMCDQCAHSQLADVDNAAVIAIGGDSDFRGCQFWVGSYDGGQVTPYLVLEPPSVTARPGDRNQRFAICDAH